MYLIQKTTLQLSTNQKKIGEEISFYSDFSIINTVD